MSGDEDRRFRRNESKIVQIDSWVSLSAFGAREFVQDAVEPEALKETKDSFHGFSDHRHVSKDAGDDQQQVQQTIDVRLLLAVLRSEPELNEDLQSVRQEVHQLLRALDVGSDVHQGLDHRPGASVRRRSKNELGRSTKNLHVFLRELPSDEATGGSDPVEDQFSEETHDLFVRVLRLEKKRSTRESFRGD